MALVILGLLTMAAVLALFVGVTVLMRDYRKLENISLFGISLGVAIWSIGIAGFNYTGSSDVALIWAKFYYFAPLLIVVSSVFFAETFSYRKHLNRLIHAIVLVGGVALTGLLLSQKTFITTEVIYKSYGKQVILDSSDYLTYSGYVVACFIIAIAVMLIKRRQATQALTRQQASLFLNGYIISCVLGVFFNLILPGLNNYSLIVIGPLASLVWLVAVAYAIIKHRLFDIRLVIARSIGYIASLVVILAIYSFIVLGVVRIVPHVQLSLLAQIVLSLATGLAILVFSHLRQIFDRATNRIFYRDAYDPQILLNNLNRLLVSTLNMDHLLHQTSLIIATQLKAEFCQIGLKGATGTAYRIAGTDKRVFTDEDIAELRQLTPHLHQTVIVADYLDAAKTNLKAVLTDNNIAVLVRLTPNARQKEEGLGYIALGPKKSGNQYSQQDVQVLGTVANEVIIAIQNVLHFEEIQQFNVTLQEKVTTATQQLRNTNVRLKALDETKDDFISMASHQLRTPLTSVKGYLSMVLEGDAGKLTAMQQQMLQQAYVSSQRMVYLIADLLNVSRLKTGKFVIMPSQINLATMIAEEIDQLRDTAKARQVTIVYEPPADFPDTLLDETKLRQVIMNFMDNAVYYTRAGGKVTVSLQATSQVIELRIQDNGIGVPKAEQHHLFTKFYRAKNARQVRPDGTGLGLFMAKKVVVAQGGVVIFDSQEGKGSTFGFSFAKQKILVPPPATPVKSAK